MKILLVTIGSLGDLHPFIAIGQALYAEGASVTLAVPQDHVAKVRAAGLTAAAILPSFDDICARVGLSRVDAVARTIADPDFVLDQVLLPSLADSVALLDPLAKDADVIVGSIFALGANIVAEKHGLPLIDIVLQPMTMFSAWQPPHAARFGAFRHTPNGALGRGWNRLLYRFARTALRRRYAGPIDHVRQDHGLARSRRAPLLDPPAARVRTLCCYARVLGPLCPDAPPDSHVVGFPLFDSASGAVVALDPRLAAFLDEGDPPIVVSLGSFAWAAAGDCYDEAHRVAQRLGRRVVLLTGEGAFRRGTDWVAIDYAPHSKLFGRCTAIVHHGGIGTVGQALRAGKPQLILPFFGDQHDNAARIQALNVGRSLLPALFHGDRAVAAMSAVLDDAEMHAAAAMTAGQVSHDDGAAAAARLILAWQPG